VNGAGPLEIVSAGFGDEELRRVQALAVIFETTPNAVIRDACSFYVSHAVGTPGYRQAVETYRRHASEMAGIPERDQAGPVSGHPGRTCPGCQMADPPPSMTCTLGRDHRVGTAAGCPGCGRLMAACALRPCSAWRRAWRGGLRVIRAQGGAR